MEIEPRITTTKMKKHILVALVVSCSACVSAQTPKTDATISTNEVVTTQDIEWGWLNPLRGDKSPAAGKLWGDRTKNEPSGFLVKFNKGFSSPPHIHNVTYRGLVIEGLVHNDDEKAEETWLPAGSFWQQPAGEAHITAASGKANMAYIEIQEGPYLVKPITEAFDNGERPVNIDKTNLVWLNASDITWVKDNSGVQTTFLWGSHKEGELNASLLKLPAAFKGKITNWSPNFKAVIIQGRITHQVAKEERVDMLDAGTYFGAAKNSVHKIDSKELESIIYIRSNGKFEVVESKS